MHIVEVLGRIFISSLFIVEAIRKFFSPDEGMIYMSDYGVPEILFYPSLIFEFVVPLILIAGFKTRLFASLLLVAAFPAAQTEIASVPQDQSQERSIERSLENTNDKSDQDLQSPEPEGKLGYKIIETIDKTSFDIRDAASFPNDI